MTLTCTNVTLRQKPLRNDRISLYLDYYPAIRNPYTMKMSRREFLGIYIYAKPKNEQQRMFNQDMLNKAEAIRCIRVQSLINEEFGFLDKNKQKVDFLAYFRTKAREKYEKWDCVYNHFEKFVSGKCTFGDVTVELCEKFRDYLLKCKQINHPNAYISRNSAAGYYSTFRALLNPLLAQPLRTGSMKVNPYMAFDPLPGSASLNPALDRWTESQTQWASAVTERFNTGHYVPGVSWVVGEDTATRTEQLGSTTNALEYLRQIDVAYRIEGFGAGEQLAAAAFDGVPLDLHGTADGNGTLDGSFRIPAKVPSGAKAVTFTGKGGSRASAVFVGQGQLTVNTLRQVNTITTIWVDPLAQTFVLDKATQLAGVDLWFTAKGGDARLQIRDVANGVPTRTVLAEALIPASSIVVSGGGHTRVLLPSPLSLAAGTEYAFVVLCDDAETALSVAELGKFEVEHINRINCNPQEAGFEMKMRTSRTSGVTTQTDYFSGFH